LARVNSDGTVTEFVGGEVPGFGAFRQPTGITTGPDGNIWFSTTRGIVGRVNGNGTITEFPWPDQQGRVRVARESFHITTGPDRNVWFTITGNYIDPGGLGRVNSDGSITLFIAGVTQGFRPCWPGAIATGPDANLWFTQHSPNLPGAVARLNGNGTVTEFLVPNRQGSLSYPRSIATGPDGNVWFFE
jgi:virginiamycin B lyase